MFFTSKWPQRQSSRDSLGGLTEHMKLLQKDLDSTRTCYVHIIDHSASLVKIAFAALQVKIIKPSLQQQLDLRL